jgi:hypothetical protein
MRRIVIVGAVCLAVGLVAGLLLAPRFPAPPPAEVAASREPAREESPPAAAPASLTFVQRGTEGRRVAFAARGLTRVTGAEAAAAADAANHRPPPPTREQLQHRDGGP